MTAEDISQTEYKAGTGRQIVGFGARRTFGGARSVLGLTKQNFVGIAWKWWKEIKKLGYGSSKTLHWLSAASEILEAKVVLDCLGRHTLRHGETIDDFSNSGIFPCLKVLL